MTKEVGPLEEVCENCTDYELVKIRAKCSDGNNMSEMKKKGCPCYSSYSSVGAIYNVKDDWENVETKYS
jgi:hypothetical protein